MMAVAFILPPWRVAWYIESPVLQQARWIIMTILFVVQCFESYASSASEKRYIADLYLLRIGWVALVQPIYLIFTLACFLYYGITMIKIHIVIPGYADIEKQTQMMVYGSPQGQSYSRQGPVLQRINDQGLGLAHLSNSTNTIQLEPEEIPGWQRFSRFN